MKNFLALTLVFSSVSGIAGPGSKPPKLNTYEVTVHAPQSGVPPRKLTAIDTTPEQMQQVFKQLGKRVITIVGSGKLKNSGDVGTRVDWLLQQYNPDEDIVVFNELGRGMSEALNFANARGFTSIVVLPASRKAEIGNLAFQANTVLFVPDDKYANATEEALAKGSDVIRGFGGDERASRIIQEGFKLQKDVRFTPLEMDYKMSRPEAGRETSPAHAGVLNSSDASLKYLGLSEELSTSNKNPGEKTFRMMEIWDYTPSPEVQRQLLSKAQEKDSPIRLVSEAEIMAGKTNDGIEIADSSPFLFKQHQFESQQLSEALNKDPKPEIRVSMASLVRVQIPGGNRDAAKYLLLVNRSSLKQGKVKLSPVGGALEVTDDASLREMGINYEKQPRELRFTAPTNRLFQIRGWFSGSKWEREFEPGRELYEELVEENPLVERDAFNRQTIRIIGRTHPGPEFASPCSLLSKLAH